MLVTCAERSESKDLWLLLPFVASNRGTGGRPGLHPRHNSTPKELRNQVRDEVVLIRTRSILRSNFQPLSRSRAKGARAPKKILTPSEAIDTFGTSRVRSRMRIEWQSQ
jgi:hypothetical protein